MEQFKVAIVARIFNNLPVWVAQERGYFESEGLEVTVEILYGVANVTDAVASGDADLVIGTPESVLSAAPADDQIVIVGGNARKLANGLIARKGIDEIGQLVGGKVGVSHRLEGTALLVREMLARHGLVAGRDYSFAEVGVASDRSKMLQEGTLDCALQTPPHKYLAEDSGHANLGDISDYVPDYQFTTLNVRRSFTRNREKSLRGFLRSLARATTWMTAEPEACVDLATRMLQTTADYARRDYEHFRRQGSLTPDLALSTPGMAMVERMMREAGTLMLDRSGVDSRIDLSFLPGH
jgi:ABC-type nitrate/sulfonate/bicarbonate transport system substrate-binding protein